MTKDVLGVVVTVTEGTQRRRFLVREENEHEAMKRLVAQNPISRGATLSNAPYSNGELLDMENGEVRELVDPD